jgi:hypothetical protein
MEQQFSPTDKGKLQYDLVAEIEYIGFAVTVYILRYINGMLNIGRSCTRKS